MGNPTLAADYNTRLFARGWYGAHHRARFHWLRRKLAALRLARASVLEIGCFDGKTIDWLPFAIDRYVGLDAGWESGQRNGSAVGLAAAQQRCRGDARFTFRRSTDPEDVWRLEGSFDVGVCLETLEHVEPADVDSYLAALAAKVRGPLLVTVPNEKGVALALKSLAAKLLRVDRDISYSPLEFVNAALGRMDRVPRHHHKGFDYAALARRLRHHFGDAVVEGVDSRYLPCWLQPTVGMIAGGGTGPTQRPGAARPPAVASSQRHHQGRGVEANAT